MGGTTALHALPDVPAELRFAPRVRAPSVKRPNPRTVRGYGLPAHPQFVSHAHRNGRPRARTEFPVGVITPHLQPGDDLEAVYQADQDAFRDHFGFVDQPFEEG